MQTLLKCNIQNILRSGEVSSRVGRKCSHDLRKNNNGGVNEKQRVFLIINGVNISLMLICSCSSYTQRKDSSNVVITHLNE